MINSIYIIDDDSITIFGLRKILGKIAKKVPVSEFRNGKTALEAIQGLVAQNKVLPSIIFLDINMPIMDGWTFLERYLEMGLDAKVRIKIITSSIDSTDRNRWKAYSNKAPFQIDFITKPIYSLKPSDLVVGMGLAS